MVGSSGLTESSLGMKSEVWVSSFKFVFCGSAFSGFEGLEKINLTTSLGAVKCIGSTGRTALAL